MIAVEKTKRVKLSELKPYPKNPRKGDVAAIVESLEAHGQYRALVVNARTNEVLAGNHTFRALEDMGAAEALVHFVDVDEDEAARIVLVDNRSNDVAGYDDVALLDLLRSLPDLDGTGYSDGDLDRMLTVLDAAKRPSGDTAAGEPPGEPRTKPADLYLLGKHRLLCGDGTSATDTERLLGGDAPEMVFTDPPYGIEYRDLKKRHRPIANDDADPEGLVRSAIAMCGVASGRPVYVCCDWRSLAAILAALEACGHEPKATIVWDKMRGVQNLDRYHKQHEFIVYAGPYGGQKTLRGDVWQIPRELNPGDHPTPKPVDLVEKALADADVLSVVDPFAGSGSTLIAAENRGLRCYAMELDPGYCDVIVDRWERHTGKKAKLDG